MPELGTDMQDYSNTPLRWVPHLMFTAPPNLNLQSLSTDQLGFRKTLFQNNFLSPAEFDWSRPVNLFLGGSTSYGYGASSDSTTIPSFLAQNSNIPWLNLGIVGYQSTQELLSFLLFYPPNINKVVLLSGLNDLQNHIVNTHLTHKNLPPIYFYSLFNRTMNQATDSWQRRLKNSITKLWKRGLKKEAPPHVSLDEKYKISLEVLEHNLKIWKDLTQIKNFSVYYVFQPCIFFSKKTLAPKEQELFALEDKISVPPSLTRLQQNLKVYSERYQRDVQGICKKLQIPFMNINDSPTFNSDLWLYSDRLHLTDLGNRLVAEHIAKFIEGEKG
jgi:hypothetical protein